MDVDSSGYHPNSFVIKAGIPVKWNINVKELTSCNSELVMNEYNIDVKLKQGINVVQFTPSKVETIQFTCGMGMLHGNFIVTETGTASQQQLSASSASAPKAGASCSMGANGGGCGCGMM
jgi:plastocyanin domain-containing protein